MVADGRERRIAGSYYTGTENAMVRALSRAGRLHAAILRDGNGRLVPGAKAEPRTSARHLEGHRGMDRVVDSDGAGRLARDLGGRNKGRAARGVRVVAACFHCRKTFRQAVWRPGELAGILLAHDRECPVAARARRATRWTLPVLGLWRRSGAGGSRPWRWK
jgi:hypothetical protein